MATTINSGYADSPKLTANIADHADVYGGRSLVFDGVTDYLQASVGYTLTDATFSLWFNYDAFHTGYLFNIYESTSSGWGLRIASDDVGIYDDTNANDAVVYNTEISTNVWYHIAVTISSNEQKLYLNGELKGSGTNIASSLSGIDGDLFIGSRRSDQQYFDGSMCDFKIFNSALTEAQVQELYKKPENTPSAVQDNLVAWYPMIEGNPESPQSIVYDHSEKKLKEETTDSTFQVDVASDTAGDHWKNIGSATSISGGKLIYDRNIGIGKFRPMTDSSTEQTFTNGSLYKLTITMDVITGHSSNQALINLDWFGGLQYFDVGTSVFYGVGDGGNLAFIISANRGSFEMSQCKVEEVLMGNHATTNFFGDENITSNVASDWTPYANAQIGNGSSTGEIYITAGSDTRGAYRSITGLTNGNTYKLTLDAYYSGTSDQIRVGVWNGSADTFTGYVNAGSYTSLTLTYTQVSSSVLIGNGIDQGNNLFIKNLSIKEVGVSSSGFETAVNEPVVPQVPLMRYNQKMVFKGTTGQYVLLDIDSLSLGDFTISFWYNTDIANGTFIGRSTNSTIRFGANVTLRIDQNNYYLSGATGTDVTNGRFLTATREGTSFKLYIDGVLSTTQTVVTDAWTFGGSGAQIGQSAWSRFEGTIHECSIFNTALTQTQVQELFNDGVALDATTHSKKGNLLGYWRNDGVTTWQDRRGWSFLDFDGSADRVQVPNNSAFNFGNGSFSISFWAKNDVDSTDAILSKIDSANKGYQIKKHSNTKWFFRANTSSNDSYIYGDATSPSTGVWTHVVCVADKSVSGNKGLKIYVNGVDSNNATGGGNFEDVGNIDVSNDLYFGIFNNVTSNSSAWDGVISSIAMYNKALSQSEIDSIYSGGIAGDESIYSDIVGYWKFNNTTTIVDLINGNNGTVTGTTLNDGNDGSVQGSPDSITVREGLNSNRDGLGFYFTNPSSNVLRLNGVDEYLNLGTLDSKIWKSSYTISLWLKPNDGQPTSGTKVFGVDDGTGADSRIFLELRANGKIELRHEAEGTVKNLITSSSVFEDGGGIWKYISLVIDTNNNNGYIYIDGSVVSSNGSGLYSGVDIGATSIEKDFYLGAENRSGSSHYSGLLDEFRIYNRALSASEVLKNYKHQKGKHKND